MQYSRYFMPLSCESPGFGFKEKQPAGRCILEAKGNAGKLSIWVQDLKPETIYGIYMIFIDGDRFAGQPVCPLSVDGKGKAEIRHDFNADNVNGCGFPLTACIAVAVMATRAAAPTAPLCGYRDKMVSWKHGYIDLSLKSMQKKEVEIRQVPKPKIPSTAEEMTKTINVEMEQVETVKALDVTKEMTAAETSEKFSEEVLFQTAEESVPMPEAGFDGDFFMEMASLSDDSTTEAASIDVASFAEAVTFDVASLAEPASFEVATLAESAGLEVESLAEVAAFDVASMEEAVNFNDDLPTEAWASEETAREDINAAEAEMAQPVFYTPPAMRYDDVNDTPMADDCTLCKTREDKEPDKTETSEQPMPHDNGPIDKPKESDSPSFSDIANQFHQALENLSRETTGKRKLTDDMEQALQSLFVNNIPLHPFRKQNRDAKWVRISLKDHIPLPFHAPALLDEPFVAEAYRQYNHLIYGITTDSGRRLCIFGVPGVYSPEQRPQAIRLGFVQFKCCDDVKTIRGEYGYWLMFINA